VIHHKVGNLLTLSERDEFSSDEILRFKDSLARHDEITI
jgi:hypothetical protein